MNHTVRKAIRQYLYGPSVEPMRRPTGVAPAARIERDVLDRERSLARRASRSLRLAGEVA